MAYSNVKTPRFYIDYGQYLSSMGVLSHPLVMDQKDEDSAWNCNINDPYAIRKIFGLNNYKKIILDDCGFAYNNNGAVVSQFFGYDPFYMNGLSQFLDNANYLAILGHNFATTNMYVMIRLKLYDPATDTNVYVPVQSGSGQALYNSEVVGSGFFKFPDDGCSIISFNGFDLETPLPIRSIALVIAPEEVAIGSGSWTGNTNSGIFFSNFSFGRYYDLPFSPDFNIKQTKEYISRTHKTAGGKILSKPKNYKRPKFGSIGEFGIKSTDLNRTGRKTWDIEYSHLEDKHIMGYNENSTPFFTEPNSSYSTEELNNSENQFNYNLNNNIVGSSLNTDLYSNVIHLTQGRLPFIFQPDNSSFGTSDFNICSFDQSSFSSRQVTYNMYSTSMKIRETW